VASRPGTGAVITIAILHFVGGGLGLLQSLCSGIGLVIISQVTLPAPPPGQVTPLPLYLLNNAPGYLAMEVAYTAVGLVFDVVLIVAGVGLLMRRPWARYLSIGYAVMSILVKVVLFVHLLAFVAPTVQKFKAQELPKVNDPVLREQEQTKANMDAFGSPCFRGFLTIYPAVVILIMLLPSVGRYFQPDPYDDRDDPDRDDDEYPRRGRSRIDRSGQIYRDDDEEDDRDRGRGRWGDEEEDDRRCRRWRDDDR
jgi:hypothetical protein